MIGSAGSNPTAGADVRACYEALRGRVMAVAARHCRCAVGAGGGKLIWGVGLPLLALTALQYGLGLPFYLRAPVLPLAAAALCWWGWRWVARPLLERYSLTRAAMLVETARPDLKTRVVSALEVYPDLQRDRPRFVPGLVRAVVRYAQNSTRGDDFRAVIDARPARRQLLLAGLTLALWAAALVADPGGVTGAMASLADAWNDVWQVAQRAAGARIVVEPLGRRAYLAGSDVTIRARQEGFHSDAMRIFLRRESARQWKSAPVAVRADGRAEFVARDVQATFQVYFAAGKIRSEAVTVTVTEPPRIVNLSVEYELPEYLRKAPIVQPRSDGNLKALYGSSVVMTIEANKDLEAAAMSGAFLASLEGAEAAEGERVAFSVAGRYARGIVRLRSAQWLADTRPEIVEKYRLSLRDEFGYANADAGHEYEMVIVKDRPPTVTFVGLPHRSSAHEPHILAQDLGGIGVYVRAADDCGVSKVTLHYRIEDLETGARKRSDARTVQFGLPRAEVPQLALLRLSDVGAGVGDRIVFWAQVEDAYDLEPDKGPHRASTPAYRVAVVTQEALFTEVVYRDDWATQWYDSLKVAALTKREIPPRRSPEREGAAKAAVKLLGAPQVAHELRAADRRLIQDYFDSLITVRTNPK